MVPRILYLHPKTYKRLIRLRKQAERDGAYRVAQRLQAVVLNSEGRTSGELAHLLGSPRSRVSEWLAHYQAFGVEGLLEGHRLIATGWVYLDRRCRALSLPFEFDAFMFLRGLSGFPSICIGLAVGAVSSLRVPFLALTVAPAAISVQARL